MPVHTCIPAYLCCLRLSRSELELCFGTSSTGPDLVEDGRATVLLQLSAGALLLTRAGELLLVHPSERPDLVRAELFRGHSDTLWEAVSQREPTAMPGGGRLPRYWLICEPYGLGCFTFGRLDLRTFEVVERAGSRDMMVQGVIEANQRNAVVLRCDVNGPQRTQCAPEAEGATREVRNGPLHVERT